MECPSCGSCLEGRASRLETRVPEEEGVPVAGATLRRIGDFQIRRRIGSGGLGTVYEAYQESMHRVVALKVMNPGIQPSSAANLRFEREAWIGGRLSHPNIVRVHGQGDESGIRYIAMELIDGRSLHEEIRRVKNEAGEDRRSSSTSQAIRHTVELFIGVADALAAVHDGGVVHRDIKPSNLLLTRDGSRLLLSDFGLARDAESAHLTRQGDFLGTVRYMSPEQLLAHRVKIDHRSDIWSFGVSLYEAVTLDLPYHADSDEGYISAVSSQEPTPARRRLRAVPRDLETILMKCLERDPARRYASMRDLREDLARFLEGRPVAARRPGPVARSMRFVRRNRVAAAAAMVAVLSSLLIVWEVLARLEDQKQIRRLRWTLEQAETTGADPASLAPDWKALQARLLKETRRNPDGALTALALDAAAQVGTELSADFGLVGAPPEVAFSHGAIVDTGLPVIYVAHLEGSLDGGPWLRAGYHYYPSTDHDRGDAMSVGLGRLFGSSNLTPGPHEVAVRARFEIFDAVGRSGAGFGEDPSAEREHLAPLRGKRPRKVMTRVLLRRTVNLFEKYPPDFPRAAAVRDLGRPLSAWLQVERVRIVRVHIPDGAASTLAYSYSNVHVETKRDPPFPSGFIACVGFTGNLDESLPIPLAADGEVLLPGRQDPLIAFPFFFGMGIIGPGGFTGSPSEICCQLPVRPEVLPVSLSGVEVPGSLRFVPSRSVALQAGKFDRYLAEPVSFPVTVSIVTVEGERAVMSEDAHGEVVGRPATH